VTKRDAIFPRQRHGVLKNSLQLAARGRRERAERETRGIAGKILNGTVIRGEKHEPMLAVKS